jgi:pimeloyl-ACP methyl ester carboxylesterase
MMDEQPKSKKGIVLAILLAVAAVTAAAGGYFYANPIGVSISLARGGLEKAGLKKKEIAGPRGQLVYFAGEQGPPMVLIHGVGNQAGSWVKVAGDLSLSRKLIVPDLAGHGESAPADGPLGLADAVAGLAAVLDAEKTGADTVLVGNSMGGWVALTYALQHPDRVARLVLVNSTGVAGTLEDFGKVSLLPKNREEALALVTALGLGGAPPPAGFILEDLVEKIAAGPTPRMVAGIKPEDYLDARLPGLKVPVEVLWGSEDRLLLPSYRDKLMAALPRARLHELPGAGHVPQQQDARAFVEKLSAVLAEAPAAAPPAAPAITP